MRFFLPLLLLMATAHAQPLTPNDPSFMQSTSPLRVGLAAYWRLEEASGTRYDCSKNGNHLTSNNSVTNGAGKVGNCAIFSSGSSQYLSVSSNTLTNNSNFTWTCWARLAVKANAPFLSVDNITLRQNNLFYNPADDRFEFFGGDFANPAKATTFGSPSTNVWYFLAAGFIKNNSNLWISVNGGVQNTNVRAASYAGIPFTIGGGNFYLTGAVDEAGVWFRTLSTNEITQLYHAGLGTHFPWAHP